MENNIDCVGGAVVVQKGRNVKILYNNIELSAGSGSPSGAIVDIDGASGAIVFPEVYGNHIGVFGTASPTSAIRLNASVGARVDHNTILSGIPVNSGVFLTASCQDAQVGFNEIQSTYTTPINNSSSVRPIGVSINAGMLNGFTNASGYRPLSFEKDINGLVHLSGVVDCPASPSGVIIATLPVGFRPTVVERFPISTLTGGNIVGYAAEIDVNGNVVAYCIGTTTRVEFNCHFRTTNYLNNNV